MKRFTLLSIVVLTCRAALAAEGPSPEAARSPADKRPTKIWNRTGPLGETPKHVTDAFPLSDQGNKGGWVKFEAMSDEFEGDGLDLDKWSLGIAPWKGRQPALFSDKNVTLSDGKLHLTMHKEEVPKEFEKLGYHDYTSAALHTQAKAGSLLVALPVTAQQPREPAKDIATELKQLQVNRVAVLKNLTNLSFVGYRQGEFKLDPVLAAQHDLMEAQLEMAETPDQRIAVLETQLKITKQTLEAAEQLRKNMEVSQCDKLRAKAALMGVEIKLLQERAKAKATAKYHGSLPDDSELNALLPRNIQWAKEQTDDFPGKGSRR